MFGTQIFESLTVKHVSRQIIQRVARDQKSFANDNLNDIVKFNKLKISILKKFDKTFCSFFSIVELLNLSCVNFTLPRKSHGESQTQLAEGAILSNKNQKRNVISVTLIVRTILLNTSI